MEEAKQMMRQSFPRLRRWREAALIRDAEVLLDVCPVITIASVNSDGFPRPVPMANGETHVCGVVWMATGPTP